MAVYKNTLYGGTIASVNDGAGSGKELAVDGNTSTTWATNSTYGVPAWWSYDYGAGKAYPTTKVRIFPYYDGNHSMLRNAKIQGSDDNTNWVDLYSIVDAPDSAAWQEYVVNSERSYRYKRIYITSTWRSDGYVGFNEVQFLYEVYPIEIAKTPLISDVNLLWYYRMNDNVDDSGPNARHGTLVGSPGYKTGIFGNTVAFTGIGTYISIPSAASIVGQTTFSVVSCYKRNGNPATYAELWSERKSNNDQPLFYLTVGANGIPFVNIRNDAGTLRNVTATTNVCDDNLHIIIFECNNGTMQMYVDGVAEGSSNSKPTSISIDAIRIGSDAKDTSTLIDSAAIADDIAGFSRILTAEEKNNLYTGAWKLVNGIYQKNQAVHRANSY